MMLVRHGSSTRCRFSDDEETREFRRAALRDAVMCIGWLRLISVLAFLGLYFVVKFYSRGHFSEMLKTATLVPIPVYIVIGTLLVMGALDEQVWALTASLWLLLLMASYTTVLGAAGGIYFLRKAKLTSQFILACMYGCLACSVCTVVCHDVIIVYMYRKAITGHPPSIRVAEDGVEQPQPP